MLVGKSNFVSVLTNLGQKQVIALDTETTGLFPFHGDRLFSIAIADEKDEYYFNWNQYPGIDQDLVLGHEELEQIQQAYHDKRLVFIHNAKYDLSILECGKLAIPKSVHCTRIGERVNYNNYLDYDLDSCGKRIGYRKDTKVDDYIKKNNLYSDKIINGTVVKSERFDLVPFMLIAERALIDARICYKLGLKQIQEIRQNTDSERGPLNILEQERKLTQVIHKMIHVGAKVDAEYCQAAIRYFNAKVVFEKEKFKNLTGHEFKKSGKLFAEVFKDQEHLWTYTEKGNPSFDKDVLKNLEGEVADCVRAFNEANSTIDFYKHFLFYRDHDSVIHTHLNSDGAGTGRFSSSNPNLQNLKKDDEESLSKAEFAVRRAIVPREGFFFLFIDYKQMEYRLMLDYANSKNLIEQVKGGKDVHEATAELAQVTRKQAKNVNFGILYGQGKDSLAASLKLPVTEAQRIKNAVLDAAPEIRTFVDKVTKKAKNYGNIMNWAGRISFFPDRNHCYKAPNYLIQGGTADIIKKAMIGIDEMLTAGKAKSRMILNIHDELVFEVSYGEEELIPKLANIMREAYPHKHLPMDVDIEYSESNMADKKPWVN